MVIQVADVLIPIAASLIPNFGFWGGTYLYRDFFHSWHVPLKSEAQLAIRDLLTADVDIPKLREERDMLRLKMEEMGNSISSMDEKGQEQICRYAENLVRVNHDLVDKENHLTNFDKYRETAEESGVGLLPKRFWIMSVANSIMGVASYLVWKSYDHFYALAIYGSTVVLYWTYYPILFTFGSKRWSFYHASLINIAAVTTTCFFWNRSRIAGIMMLPFLGVLSYVAMEIYEVTQDDADVRLIAHRLRVHTPHISIRIV
ncbi:hypothetical protein GE061_009884 [Apolygus lucorum]|uniref:Uncharacterized protein n=1 Tax=Apolygus lucorum TaxID=248454 RepID=A0A8S9Y2U3_APOLU|nr:hypothetical protein GE061_009884 [Apolygus lucorum]